MGEGRLVCWLCWKHDKKREQHAAVLELVAQGARDREIAQEFVISESTVKKHVQNILRKLQARNRAEAVARLRDGAA